MSFFNFFKSKTVVGAAVAAFGYVSTPPIFNLLSPHTAGVVTAIGGLLTAIGVRHAIDKGPTQ